MKKYIVNSSGDVIDKTTGKVITSAKNILLPDDGNTDLFYTPQLVNLNYYSKVCNISTDEAVKIFGRVFD